MPMILFAVVMLVMAAGPAWATSDGEGVPDPSQRGQVIEQCKSEHAGCVAACSSIHADDPAGQTGCEARCAADRAACEAVAGYQKMEPWLKDQAGRIDRLMDGLTRRQGDTPLTGKQCGDAFASCSTQCAGEFPDEQDEARIGCDAMCQAERAACETIAGFEAAKPAIKDYADQIQRLLDGFLRRMPKDEPAPAPAPEPAPESKPPAPAARPEYPEYKDI